jgi:hypothetical protein
MMFENRSSGKNKSQTLLGNVAGLPGTTVIRLPESLKSMLKGIGAVYKPPLENPSRRNTTVGDYLATP